MRKEKAIDQTTLVRVFEAYLKENEKRTDFSARISLATPSPALPRPAKPRRAMFHDATKPVKRWSNRSRV